MNYPVIPEQEFAARERELNRIMAENDIDMVMAFSNLLDPSAVRYYADFSSVNESAAASTITT